MIAHVRLRAVSGLATCGVCGTLVSFEISCEQLESFERVSCPRCKGTGEIHRDTIIPVLELSEAVTGGLE